ncbi:MAG TPA: type III-B CRISPR module-associated protein Cmr3 [Thermoanaerobaculia bacterium]|jgi:CRISPR-associated protein Cmr3
MSVWLVEPLDPLIARDGRPSSVGGHFFTVSFPYPSMLAGAVRTRMGCENGAFTVPKGSLNDLKEKVVVQGPLLAELKADSDDVLQWFAPAPRDLTILQGDDKKTTIRRLIPCPLHPGEAMDSLSEEGLHPVGSAGEETYGKPPKDLPAFWNWMDFEAWLTHPADRSDVNLKTLGIEALPIETRAHLAIQPGERVGIDGMFFQTSGLRFLQKGDSLLEPRRFALSLSCQGANVAGRDLKMERQIAPLGGERRLARWSPASKEWPRMPEAVREKIVATRRARLILLTPALFKKGALPGWNGEAWPLGGPVKARVASACVPRPAVVSGWDLAKGRPKETKRLALAGSVYFVELDGTPEEIQRWCEESWLACLSDDAQDRRDGFGLAALGTWEEQP